MIFQVAGVCVDKLLLLTMLKQHLQAVGHSTNAEVLGGLRHYSEINDQDPVIFNFKTLLK